ncbi:MAG: 50S ribosomal protein L9 [Oligoflexia bacterium]|nr:50S ribosomal protein L9 [Oligoflexia bacterium]
MEVILQENYPSLGYVGDRVSVKGGFARNFLIPRGIAVEASMRNERLLKHRLQHIIAKRIRMRSEAEAFAKQLGETRLEFTLKMSDGGKSFGAITSRDVEAGLKAKGIEVDRRQIRLTETLRKAGDYQVAVKLHAEVSAMVPVKLIAEINEPKAAKDGGKELKKGKGRRSAKKTEGEEAAPAAETPADTE